MRFSLKVVGTGIALGGLIGATTLAWPLGRPVVTEAAHVDDAPCAATPEACGAHARPKGHAAATRVEGRPRLVVFTSHSCPACKRMNPVVDAAIKACDGARDIERVDFDDEAGEALARTYDITLLPSFVSVDAAGREVARLTGLQPQERLEHALEEVRGLRCASVQRAEDKKTM